MRIIIDPPRFTTWLSIANRTYQVARQAEHRHPADLLAHVDTSPFTGRRRPPDHIA
ncbi:hypothetical protein [Streptomyces sp. NPDC056544]|uniref:hypothetical protein n=1 Tax=unclassified Streptomyces TaxID=2593676 RepID=UPI00369D92C5